jgi:hypothetical protein
MNCKTLQFFTTCQKSKKQRRLNKWYTLAFIIASDVSQVQIYILINRRKIVS